MENDEEILLSNTGMLGGLYNRRRREEHTTDTEEKAMAAPAAMGGTIIPNGMANAPAAIGTPAKL